MHSFSLLFGRAISSTWRCVGADVFMTLCMGLGNAAVAAEAWSDYLAIAKEL